jgi:hypothetical protein
MTIDELVEHYYDDLDGAITGFSRNTDALDIKFEYDESFQGEARVATIRCTGVRECTLHPGGVEALSHPAEHPLLWQHVQPIQHLYFASSPASPFELLGRLYSAHHQLFGEWRVPRDYIHATAEILSGQSGQLAPWSRACDHRVSHSRRAVRSLLGYHSIPAEGTFTASPV